MFSIVIPAHNEEAYIAACLDSVAGAARPYPGEVETVVVVNRCTDRTEAIARQRGAVIVHEDARNLARIRNAGARAARGEILCTIDADSRMSANMLQEIERRLSSGKYVGGGVRVKPDRWSLGIVVSAVILLLLMIRSYVSGGLFWLYRRDFEALGGFDERWVCVEDLDFARRLRAFGRARGQRYGTLMRAHIRTSCRKFDQFGDWHMVLNPRRVRALLSGRDQKAADEYYYDARSPAQGRGDRQ